MVALDEDALICDMAETYHVFDMDSLPVEYAATLASGLRDSSRIKLKACGLKVEINTLLLAHIADNTQLNLWAKTKDGQKGRNKPPSKVEALSNTVDESKKAKVFATGEEFMQEWRRLNGN